MRELSDSEINIIQNTADDWHYVQLGQFARRLNRALNQYTIQEAYDSVMRSYTNVRRWEILRNKLTNYLPKPIQPREGQQFVRPVDADSCDWRWDRQKPGRTPLFWDYCCHGACHWLTEANLLVAQRLFPDTNWQIISNLFHTSVLNFENRLLFDLNYVALDVPGPEAAALLIKEDPEGDVPFIFEDPNEYSASDMSLTSAANRFWGMVDGMAGTDEQKLELIEKARDQGIIDTLDDNKNHRHQLAMAALELA